MSSAHTYRERERESVCTYAHRYNSKATIFATTLHLIQQSSNRASACDSQKSLIKLIKESFGPFLCSKKYKYVHQFEDHMNRHQNDAPNFVSANIHKGVIQRVIINYYFPGTNPASLHKTNHLCTC
jgi:hypothetical protein